LGYSHPIDIVLPDSIKGEVEQDPKGNSILTLTSPNKQLIGQIAAQIRSKRPPEPYKGKGVRYFDEQIKLKPGKSAK
jgi:large subunit ribosomal protein L6